MDRMEIPNPNNLNLVDATSFRRASNARPQVEGGSFMIQENSNQPKQQLQPSQISATSFRKNASAFSFLEHLPRNRAFAENTTTLTGSGASADISSVESIQKLAFLVTTKTTENNPEAHARMWRSRRHSCEVAQAVVAGIQACKEDAERAPAWRATLSPRSPRSSQSSSNGDVGQALSNEIDFLEMRRHTGTLTMGTSPARTLGGMTSQPGKVFRKASQPITPPASMAVAAPTPTRAPLRSRTPARVQEPAMRWRSRSVPKCLESMGQDNDKGAAAGGARTPRCSDSGLLCCPRPAPALPSPTSPSVPPSLMQPEPRLSMESRDDLCQLRTFRAARNASRLSSQRDSVQSLYSWEDEGELAAADQLVQRSHSVGANLQGDTSLLGGLYQTLDAQKELVEGMKGELGESASSGGMSARLSDTTFSYSYVSDSGGSYAGRMRAFQLLEGQQQDSNIFMNLWLADSIAKTVNVGELDETSKEALDVGGELEHSPLRMSDEPRSSLFGRSPQEPLAISQPTMQKDNALEKMYKANLSELHVRSQALLFSVVAVLLQIPLAYPFLMANRQGASHQLQWLQLLELETVLFYVVCAMLLWGVQVSVKLQELLQAHARHQLLVFIASVHAICSFELAPLALAWGRYTFLEHDEYSAVVAGIFSHTMWQLESPLSQALVCCLLACLINSSAGLTRRNALTLNANWMILRLSMLAMYYHLAWNLPVPAGGGLCVTNSATLSRVLGLPEEAHCSEPEPAHHQRNVTLVLGLLAALAIQMCTLDLSLEPKLLAHFAMVRKRWDQDLVVHSAIQQMVPKRFLLLHSQFNWRGEGVNMQPELLVESFKQVTILFCSFSKQDVIALGDPDSFLRLIGDIFSRFDLLVRKHNLFKVEHICEDYVVASSDIQEGPQVLTPEEEVYAAERNVVQMVKLGQMLLEVAEECMAGTGKQLSFRVGMHSGPIMGGIAGIQRRFYRLFGDTMNTTARMCQLAPPGRIHMSSDAVALLPEEADILLDACGEIEVKGKGTLETFLVAQSSGVCSRNTTATLTMSDASSGEGEGTHRRTTCTSRMSRVSCVSREGMQLREFLAFTESPTARSEHEELSKQSDAEHLPQLNVPLLQAQISWLSGKFVDPTEEAKYLEACKKRYHWTHIQFAFTTANMLPILFFVALWLARDAMMLEIQEKLTWKLTVLGIANLAGQAWLHLMLHMRQNAVTSWMFTCAMALASNSMVGLAIIGIEARTVLLGLTIVLCDLASVENTSAYKLICSVIPVATTYIVFMLRGRSMWAELSIHVALMLFVASADRRRNALSRHLWQQVAHCAMQHEEVMRVWFDLIPNTGARRYLLGRQAMLMKATHSLSSTQDFEVAWVKPENNEAAVLSFDLASFTQVSERLGSFGVVELLHDLWCIMDTALGQFQKMPTAEEKHHELFNDKDEILPPGAPSAEWRPFPFKMDTVGDAYIVVILMSDSSSAQRQASVDCLLNVARAIIRGIEKYGEATPHGLPLGMVQGRMGLCIDRVVAGVVGMTQSRYHIYGEAIRKAAELESKSLPNHVRVDAKACKFCGYQQLIDLRAGASNSSSFKLHESEIAAFVKRSYI